MKTFDTVIKKFRAFVDWTGIRRPDAEPSVKVRTVTEAEWKKIQDNLPKEPF